MPKLRSLQLEKAEKNNFRLAADCAAVLFELPLPTLDTLMINGGEKGERKWLFMDRIRI